MSRPSAQSLGRAGLLAVLATLATLGSAWAEEGYTTWYGPGFQGNRMANGQIFDMNDPTTTASNQYPFGTWLRVTNPNNGRSVVVQVRDRGGFGHALDLSKAAFFALNPPNSWGFRVQYEVVPGPNAVKPPPQPARRPTPERAEPTSRGGVRIPAGASEHVVGPGDTLRSIAEASGISVASLIGLNDLANPDSLVIGQKLILRSRPKVRTYAVQPGDTLGSIAESSGVERAAIVEANELDDPDLLSPGQVLKIPG